MAAELPRPGVEVIQEFRTTSPTVVTPTLLPCIVGACRQIVEVLDSSSALDADARVTLPVYFVATNASLSGSRYVYTGLNTKVWVFSVNNSPDVTVTFADDYLTPAAVVSAVNSAMNTAGVFGAIAEVVNEYDTDGARIQRTWSMRSTSTGDNQKIEVRSTTDDEVWSAFGIKPSWTYAGKELYDGTWFDIPWKAFPDPRGNLDELEFDSASLRLFFASSSSNVQELSRLEGFCRRGSTVYAYDDGDGDALTPMVQVTGEDFTSTATAAVVTGTVDITGLTLPGDLLGKTLQLQGNHADQTWTFINTTSYPLTDDTELLAQLNAFFDEDFVFTKNGSDYLVITSKEVGQDSQVSVLGGTAIEELGLTASHVGTVDLTGVSYGGGGALETLTVIIDGVTHTFAAGQPTDENDLVSELGTTFGAGYEFSVQATTNYLVIKKVGVGSFVVGAGTANAVLGVTADTYAGPAQVDGTPYPVQSGDELFIEGLSYGVIIEVAPGGEVTRLKLSTEVGMTVNAYHQGTVDLTTKTATDWQSKTLTLDGTLQTTGASLATTALLAANLTTLFPDFTFTVVESSGAEYLKVEKTVGSGPFTIGATGTLLTEVGFTAATYNPVLGDNFYIRAKNLTGAATRPQPELQVASGPMPQIAPDLLRDTAGVPSSTAKSNVYMYYEALRKDVSTAAQRPNLLKVGSITDLESLLSPISADNPLALGLYFALLNVTNVEVTGIGVDESSDDAPEGTVEAFTRAADFLEGVEVYAIAPLTLDRTVAQVYSLHASGMSEPDQKGERVVLMSTGLPTHELDTLVASGTDGNSLGADTFDTGIPNLSNLLLNAGVPNPVGTISADEGVFLDIATDGEYYSVESVSGSIVTIRRTFTSGENEDGFYAQAPDLFPPSGGTLISETFAVKVRGAALALANGMPDNSAIASTVASFAQTFQNRRFWHIVPDSCAALIDGVEQLLPSYYICAAYAGLIAGQPPQQSFTNFPLTGITRVIGSNDRFSESQLNVMAGGGNWVVVQDTEVSPVIARMALTTDVTSIETRTDSITKVVDFTAKIMRQSYKNFIGRFNVTQGFLDSLGHVGQGVLQFLIETGVLIGGNLNNIVQDEAAPDTVLVDVTLDPPYPCNYIRLTLVI